MKLMNLAHAVVQSRPNVADPQRAALLMGAGASFRIPLPRAIRQIPLARAVLGSTVAMVNATATAGPMLVGQRLLGPAAAKPELSAEVLSEIADPSAVQTTSVRSPALRKQQRKAALVGSAAAIATGVLVQRAATHSSYADTPVARLGRVLGDQLATGGAAGAIVSTTELALGSSGRRILATPRSGLLLSALLAGGQVRALRRASGTLTLPTQRHHQGTLPMAFRSV